MLGYPRGKDGLLGISRFCPARNSSLSLASQLCNKPFIDQACSVKMAEYCPNLFFITYLLTSTSSRSINTQKKLDRTSLVNNKYRKFSIKPPSQVSPLSEISPPPLFSEGES